MPDPAGQALHRQPDVCLRRGPARGHPLREAVLPAEADLEELLGRGPRLEEIDLGALGQRRGQRNDR